MCEVTCMFLNVNVTMVLVIAHLPKVLSAEFRPHFFFSFYCVCQSLTDQLVHLQFWYRWHGFAE